MKNEGEHYMNNLAFRSQTTDGRDGTRYKWNGAVATLNLYQVMKEYQVMKDPLYV